VADIAEIVRAKVRTCAGHRALLCYSLGNEIPAPIARWLGRRKIERYLERLYRVVKEEDPGALVTYVNYPTTEYLQLPFLDLVCFNVYLESKDRFDSYLARLQNIAGNRPLMMSELGLDSLRNGEDAQARSLDFQVRAAFAAGCAGAFVFSWTDEWHRHGGDVEDWAFGLTRADRSPKPALQAVSGQLHPNIAPAASPPPHWPNYPASTFPNTPRAPVGGPNLPPSEDGSIAECVAHAPGGPVHVLLTDSEAEHIPGCNMAFRKDRLEAIGGFDPRFRTAGDDVDVCWRLQARNWTLGFSAAAQVWHHPRRSVRAYWRQQRGYGRAEAMLERKWPEKYNGPGHVTWSGRVYGQGLVR